MYEFGLLHRGNVGFTAVGVSPAFNINLKSVLFSSEITSGEYKLTVLDDKMTVSASGASRSGREVAVPATASGTHNRISVVMTDGEWTDSGWSGGAALKFYGEVSGGKFTLPANYSPAWKTYVLAEQVNGAKETDYASAPAELTIEEEPVKVAYSVTAGDGQTWIRGAGNAKAASFTFKGSPSDADTYKNFTGIRVDGTDVEEEDFTARQGSVVIGLRAPYLESLADGQHTLTAVFTDGEADAGFKIKQSPGKKPVNGGSVPRTGDGSHPALWALLAVVSLAALAMRRRS